MLHHMNRAVAGNVDPRFENVVLLLHGDGTNGAQNNTFLDSSTNNLSITRNGNTTQGSFSPYGSNWSNYFDSTQYAQVASNAALGLGAGTFTIEAWVFVTGGSSRQFFISANDSTQWGLCINGTNNLEFRAATTGGNDITGTTAVALNTWHHVAVVREGTGTNQVKTYLNGVLEATGTVATNYGAAGVNISTGRTAGTNSAVVANYISNLRIVKGTAVYTGNFTPSTTPLTAITNTSLLTCQSNRFIDNSTNAFAITVTGTPSVQRFSPFSPTAAYSTSVIGGSGYFDGTGDFLNFSTRTLNGDFCGECWFYRTTSTTSCIFGGADPAVTNSNTQFDIETTGAVTLVLVGVIVINAVGTAVLINQWNHIAWVRSGTGTNNCAIFVNGVRQGQGTSTSNVSTFDRIGCIGSTKLATGYISNARMVIGSSVYDPAQSTITVPTTPLTAITNTQLLCNFTNGAIFDNSMMNVLETISSTQISTTSPKFGTGSILFNGTTDYLTSPFGRNFTFCTGDFTIEFWVRFTGTTGRQDILWINVGASDRLGIIYNISANNITYYISPTVGNAINAPFTPTAGTWYHIALTRASGSSKLFINGTQGGSTYADSRNYSTAYQLFMGRDSAAASSYLNGRVDDFRITRGIARYTANFTPSQQPFPNR